MKTQTNLQMVQQFMAIWIGRPKNWLVSQVQFTSHFCPLPTFQA